MAQGHAERERAGQEPLLEQHRRRCRRPAWCRCAWRCAVTISSSSENISCSLVVGRERQRLDLPGLEALALQVALEPADRDVLQRLGVQQGPAGEPARVDHLHQRGERLRMAVVRGRRSGKAGARTCPRVGAPRPCVGCPPHSRGRRRSPTGSPAPRGAPRPRSATSNANRLPDFGLVACAYTSRSSRWARTCGSHAMLHDHPRVQQERVGVQPVGAAHLRPSARC